MIKTNSELISDLPVLEIVKDHLSDEQLPTVFFYHGWESYKERVLEEAYSLAEADFRVVLPDAFNHGERNVNKLELMIFWEVVDKSVKEFMVIVDHYVNTNKTMIDRVGVSGLSMGGITASVILTQYDWVKSATILMGSPAPIELTKWLLENDKLDSMDNNNLRNKDFVEKKLNDLIPLSLNLQAEKLAGRPVYFWHGTEDKVVPAKTTIDFVEKNQKKDYGKNLSLELTKGVGHRVPREIIQKMTNYFQEHL